MSSSGGTTTDHETIKNWAESRGGRPSVVRTEGGKGKKKSGGILRFDFGPHDEPLEETSWDEFFEVFDQSNITFLYQDKTKDGKVSRFNRFIHKDAETAPKKAAAKGTTARRTASAKAASSSRGSADGETKASLMEKAKQKGVAGRSRMSKAELEKAVA